MVSKFGEIAFTSEVKVAQAQRGSRETYERYIARGAANDSVTPALAEFLGRLDGFYLGTVNSNGYPYIQFRGGPPGFLQVLDDKTLGFADFSGNAQYITVGNLQGQAQAFLFLMDYRHRRRIKVWGHAQYVEGDTALLEQLSMPAYPAKAERAIVFTVEAFSENCSQHIPVRYSAAEIEEITAPLKKRIRELELDLQKRDQSKNLPLN